MIDQLVGLALRKRPVVALICCFAAIYGYYSWTGLAVEAYPDIADVSAQVVTPAPGLAAEEVEQQIRSRLNVNSTAHRECSSCDQRVRSDCP